MKRKLEEHNSFNLWNIQSVEFEERKTNEKKENEQTKKVRQKNIYYEEKWTK